jgi:hypothetical protein
VKPSDGGGFDAVRGVSHLTRECADRSTLRLPDAPAQARERYCDSSRADVVRTSHKLAVGARWLTGVDAAQEPEALILAVQGTRMFPN